MGSKAAFAIVALVVGLWLGYWLGKRDAASRTPAEAAPCHHDAKVFRCVRYLGNYDGDTLRFAIPGVHPLIGENQTCGLMGALQIVKDKRTGQVFDSKLEVGMLCRAHCFGNGLIMRAVGDRMIIAPPLVMTLAQIDEMVELIRKCLDLTQAELKQREWL